MASGQVRLEGQFSGKIFAGTHCLDVLLPLSDEVAWVNLASLMSTLERNAKEAASMPRAPKDAIAKAELLSSIAAVMKAAMGPYELGGQWRSEEEAVAVLQCELREKAAELQMLSQVGARLREQNDSLAKRLGIWSCWGAFSQWCNGDRGSAKSIKTGDAVVQGGMAPQQIEQQHDYRVLLNVNLAGRVATKGHYLDVTLPIRGDLPSDSLLRVVTVLQEASTQFTSYLGTSTEEQGGGAGRDLAQVLASLAQILESDVELETFSSGLPDFGRSQASYSLLEGRDEALKGSLAVTRRQQERPGSPSSSPASSQQGLWLPKRSPAGLSASEPLGRRDPELARQWSFGVQTSPVSPYRPAEESKTEKMRLEGRIAELTQELRHLREDQARINFEAELLKRRSASPANRKVDAEELRAEKATLESQVRELKEELQQEREESSRNRVDAMQMRQRNTTLAAFLASAESSAQTLRSTLSKTAMAQRPSSQSKPPTPTPTPPVGSPMAVPAARTPLAPVSPPNGAVRLPRPALMRPRDPAQGLASDAALLADMKELERWASELRTMTAASREEGRRTASTPRFRTGASATAPTHSPRTPRH